MNIGVKPHNLPLVGGLFEDPAQEAHQRNLKQAEQAYADYRPIAIEARMNALKNLFSLFGPTNQMLGQMGLPQYNFTQATQNPFPDKPGSPASTAPKPETTTGGGVFGRFRGAVK
ncbi:MAG: hypothetical protein NW202_13510 [Nitrospira sp.]|nr:hypothetical protein [Nitrospira sp.]